jgi:glucosamine--fructose-6-phosphate aminotransferase (isomerizing)
MCGIVGILGKNAVATQVVDALKRLEYRGYDSAGVATLENGHLTRRRAEGKLRNLELKLSEAPLTGAIGIGHTRWATHGRPNETNAHPHATDKLAVVHNGIIENYRALKAELQAEGVVFETDTDTEVVAQLVTHKLREGKTPMEAVATTLPRLRGAFALAFLFEGEADQLIGARHGAPLAIGYGDGEMYLGSDALALAPFTDEVSYLNDGDWAVLSRSGAVVRDKDGHPVERQRQTIPAGSFLASKGNYRHFMAKEIYEQPEVVGRTIAHYADFERGKVCLPDLPFSFADLRRVSISACGTAFYAGLVAKYWFERLARLPVEIDVASEFRYREAPLDPGQLALFVSQSGETADTLASLYYARDAGQHVLSVVNVPTSTMARESAAVAPTLAGQEIGVASTKAFTCQLSVLLAARHRGRAGEGRPVPRATRSGSSTCFSACRPDDRRAQGRGRDRDRGPRGREGARRPLSRPWDLLPACSGRGAETQGDQLHPRGGLRRGGTEAWADRAHRRDHAGRRDRPARFRVREDRVEHAGGRRPRR